MTPRRIFATLIAAAAFAVLVAACGGSSGGSTSEQTSSGASSTVASQELENVTVGDEPVFDFALYRVAHELGFDKELGLNLEFQSFAFLPFKELARGDLDVIASAPSAAFPLYESIPGYRDFVVAADFRGFALIGRPGESKTYEEYLAAANGDAKKAKSEFVNGELPGKSVCLVKSYGAANMQGMLKLGGLTLEAIKLVDFPDDAKAAEAYLAGGCDYYTGSLPQEVRLLTHFKEQAVEIAPQEAFGPAPGGITFYSTFATTDEYLSEHRETIKKMVAIWLRAAQYAHDDVDAVVPLAYDAVKEATGNELDEASVKTAITKYLIYPDVQESKERVYNPGNPSNYINSVEELFTNAQEAGEISSGLELAPHEVNEELFQEVMKDPELVKFIAAPVK